jgi:hypothetical protein
MRQGGRLMASLADLYARWRDPQNQRRDVTRRAIQARRAALDAYARAPEAVTDPRVLARLSADADDLTLATSGAPHTYFEIRGERVPYARVAVHLRGRLADSAG